MTVNLFKALADETRLRLLRLLLFHEFSVNELVTILNMQQSRVSRHLKILVEVGLLTFERNGLFVIYHVSKEAHIEKFISSILYLLHDVPELNQDLYTAKDVLKSKSETKKVRKRKKRGQFYQEILGDVNFSNLVQHAMPKNCGTSALLGCDYPSIVRDLLEHSDYVICVDINPTMVAACKEYVETSSDLPITKLSPRIGSLEHLPIRDNEVDFISMNMVLHHIEDTRQALTEAYRVLSTRGRLFLIDFQRHDDEAMQARYEDKIRGFEENRLAILLREIGFKRTVIRKQKLEHGLTVLFVTSYASLEGNS